MPDPGFRPVDPGGLRLPGTDKSDAKLVIMPDPGRSGGLPTTKGGEGKSDAKLVIMPDPGFRPADPQPDKKLGSQLP
jgi:hypothetical protein